MVTIPAGARSIRVVELNTSSSYLAIRDTQRRYYLNGHWTVDWPGRHPIAGAMFEYKRPYNRPESLISTGPTNETLIIEVRNWWTPLSPVFIPLWLTELLISIDIILCYFLSFFISLFLLHSFSRRYCCRAGTQVYAGNTLWGNLMRKGITSNTIIHGQSYAPSAQQLVPEVSVVMNYNTFWYLLVLVFLCIFKSKIISKSIVSMKRDRSPLDLQSGSGSKAQSDLSHL